MASAGMTPVVSYAAGLCASAIGGFSGWYLPAICEMGFQSTNSNSSGCGTSTPIMQNIQSSLIDYAGFVAFTGNYWSSSQFSGVPETSAWYQTFGSGSSVQQNDAKSAQNSVLCIRAITT